MTTPLSVEHLRRVVAIYKGLRIDNPLLSDLPENPMWIRWRYLKSNRWRCYGTAEDSRLGVKISINPFAFEEGWDLVLVGIINHEMCHVLRPDLGHEPPFHDLESGWDKLADFQVALQEFRSFAERLAHDRTLVHTYECPQCWKKISTDRILPKGSGCKQCAMKKNRGRVSPHYALIYVGTEGINHGNR